MARHSVLGLYLEPFRSRLRISPHYLSTKRDQELALKGLELAREMAQHPLLQEIGAEEVDPPAVTDLAYAQQVAETIYHPAGTCKMGRDEDAVVDEQLKVRLGVGTLLENGAVGTASRACVWWIAPSCPASPLATPMPGAHTSLHVMHEVPTVMIAEKAAQLMS